MTEPEFERLVARIGNHPTTYVSHHYGRQYVDSKPRTECHIRVISTDGGLEHLIGQLEELGFTHSTFTNGPVLVHLFTGKPLES